MTHCSTYTTPHLPPTLGARRAVGNAFRSNKCRPVKSSKPTPSIPLRLLPNHNPSSQRLRFLFHTLHYTSTHYFHPARQSIHKAGAAKFNAVFNTTICLCVRLSAPSVWQYTLKTTQPSMNHHTVSSRHYPARTPPHRFLKHTTKYLLNHKMTHCSIYATPGLPPTLVARHAVWQRIHVNTYRPLKSF